jgi:hypothetical protein
MSFKLFDIFEVFNVFEACSVDALGVSNCFSPLARSGTIYGKDDSLGLGTDTLYPEYLTSGSYIYALRCDTSNGDFELRLGSSGDYEEPNASMFIYAFKKEHVELQWNGVDRYVGNNQNMANLWAQYAGKRLCIGGIAIPKLLIHYTFEKIEG